MLEDLDWSTIGLLFWTGAGFLSALGLTIGYMIRHEPYLTTQTNRKTGIKHHSMFLWCSAFMGLCVGPPVFLLIVGWLADHWWMMPIIGAAGLTVFAWVYFRGKNAPPRIPDMETEGEELPTAVMPADPYRTPFQHGQQPQAPAIWSAPQLEGNWDPRRG